MGCDDTPPARWAQPLTTVRQDLVGRPAGESALHLLAGERVPEPAIMDVELVVRDSTDPAQ